MRVSPAGLDLIKRWEGRRLKAYRDIAGIWTIGCGHTAAAGDPVPRSGMTITDDEAEDILRSDLRQYEDAVSRAIKLPVHQHQFDAMVSLCFNIGPAAFRKSTMVRRLNAGDIDGAAEALTWFNKAGGQRVQGLANRREAERALFLSHDSDAAETPGKAEGGEHPSLIEIILNIIRGIFGGRA